MSSVVTSLEMLPGFAEATPSLHDCCIFIGMQRILAGGMKSWPDIFFQAEIMAGLQD